MATNLELRPAFFLRFAWMNANYQGQVGLEVLVWIRGELKSSLIHSH